MVRIWVLFFAVIFLGSTASLAFAAPKPPKAVVDRNKDGIVDKKEIKYEKSKVDTNWERKADIDKDGKVEPNEMNAWKHGKAKVNTPAESKYDLNGDGWLQPEEAKEYLKDRYEIIKTNGKAKVNTAVEAGYDTNKDGIIDASEAEAMKEDLK